MGRQRGAGREVQAERCKQREASRESREKQCSIMLCGCYKNALFRYLCLTASAGAGAATGEGAAADCV
jgi:hypothetical protein